MSRERCALLVAAVTGIWLAGAAVADEAGRLYVGVGLGRFDYRSDFRGVGYGDSMSAARLYGGFQLRERTAIELTLAAADDLRTGEVPGSGIERLDISADYGAIGVRGMFRLPLRDVVREWQRITVFVTAGAFAADEKRRVVEIVAARTRDEVVDDGGISYGAGVVYGLPRFSVRTALERLDGRDEDHTVVEIAAEFRF